MTQWGSDVMKCFFVPEKFLRIISIFSHIGNTHSPHLPFFYRSDVINEKSFFKVLKNQERKKKGKGREREKENNTN